MIFIINISYFRKNFVLSRLYFCGFLFWICSTLLWGQGSPSAVRLSVGGRVTNAVIYQNSGYKSVSTECSTTYSALDSMVLGIGNIQLISSPFIQQFRIGLNSPAYDNGTSDVLRDSDTLDLDNNHRTKCDETDMGAFELQLPETAIIRNPHDIRTLAGAIPAYSLTVEAEGENLQYQWQRNNVDLTGQTSDTLYLAGQWQDMGVYRVIVSGDCCKDTSELFRVMYDKEQVFYGGFCLFEESWASVWTSGQIYTFLWDNGATDSMVRDLDAGSHWVDITDTSSRTKRVYFSPEDYTPVSSAIFSVTMPDNENCDNGAIQISPAFADKIEDSVIYSLLWTENGAYYSEERDLSHLPSGLNVYQIEITKESTGCTDTFAFTLSCQHQFNPATTFISPNGDGLNDYLDIKNIEHYPVNRVTILNVYGEVIFSTENYDNDKVVWLGQNRHGKLVPDGVYNYIVETNGLSVMSGWLVMKIAE